MKHFRHMLLPLLIGLLSYAGKAQCSFTLSVLPTPVSCAGQNDGAMNLTVTGGTGPFTYQWSTSANTQDIGALSAGTYTVTVTDASACTATISSTVLSSAALTLSANDLLLDCINTSTFITMNVTGGNIPPFQWFMPLAGSGSAGSAPFVINSVVTQPGAYSITVTNGNGCSAVETVLINQDFTQPLANAGQDGGLDCNTVSWPLNGAGSSVGPNFVYSWNALGGGNIVTGANTLNPVVSQAGNYVLTVTNTQNGCTATDAVIISQNQVIPVADAGPPQNLNCNVNEVTLNGTNSSIGPNLTYLWTSTSGHIVSNANTLAVSVDAPGTYQLEVTDQVNGCTSVATTTVNGDFDTPLISLQQAYGLPCGGGSVTLQWPGGASQSYAWTGPNNFSSQVQNPSVNFPGDYTLIVTNNLNGCTSIASVSVYPGPVIPAQNFTVTNLSCAGGSTGAIDMQVDFGTGPYTYLWSNGAALEDLNNISEGTYSVTVDDATGCSYYAVVTVMKEPTPAVLTLSSAPVSCLSPNSGAINLQVSNGTFSYAWTGPQGFTSLLEDPTGLAQGIYTVTVTDALGCTKSGSVTVNAPPPMSLPQSGIVIGHPGCNGSSNGLIQISVQGGIGPFTFDWSNDGPETPDNDTQDLMGVPAGTYTVTVTGANGCTLVSSPFTLIEPQPLQITGSVTHVTCGGPGNNGAIALTVSGSGSPYTYHWSNGSTAKNISMLPAGTYTVTITRSNACTTIRSFTVLTGGTSIPPANFLVTAESCQIGASDGAITLNTLPAGAQGPMTYLWNGPFAFSSSQQNITGLPAGVYTLLLTDITGCQYTAGITVDKLPADINIDLNIHYTGCTEGSVLLSASGGSAPYTYMWSNGSSLQDLGFTVPGFYTVTVTDAGNCTKTASITVLQPFFLTLTLIPSQVTCLGGGSDGAIDLAVSGGPSTYSYQWNNNVFTEDLSNLAPGTYCVTVTDDNLGCVEVGCTQVTMNGISGIVTQNIPPTCSGSSDGSFTVELTNNPGPGPYSWSLTGPVAQNGVSPATIIPISGLPGGSYCVTITNADGCTALNCITLTTPPPVLVALEALSNTCNAAVIGATITGGVAPLEFTWQGPVAISSTEKIIVAPVSGVYQLQVTDANGCTGLGTINIALANGGNCGYIRGFVTNDNNENCVPDASEPGLAGWIVRAEGADTLYGITDANGQYLIGAPTGNYNLEVVLPNNLWANCPVTLQASVNQPNDTVYAGKIPVKPVFYCPALNVSISTAQLRRCFSNNYYSVIYCNTGTAIATNAYIDITFDPFINYIHSAAPSQVIGNNVRRFFVGTVDIGECRFFTVQVSVSCSAALGQTHCTEAHIFPDSLCNSNVQWSGASIDLRSVCSSDSLRFVIKNVGSGNMSEVLGYVVVEDAVMVMQASLPLLPAGDSVLVAFPANGSTWRMEVEQEVFHPYPQPASLSVEGCTSGSSFSTGFVNQFTLNDSPPAVDIDCTSNIGSFDPNDKQGFPIGYGAAHYVRPGTEIDYLVRFQNTGTDTAFTVQLIDTLSSWLDPASVRFGAASHPYRYDISGEGVVHIIFDNIMLPDSNVNEGASHGFARFSVSPRPTAPLETLIENKAEIYFDYNAPVVTNTTFHRLGENFISVGLWQPKVPEARIFATPNPFGEETLLEVKGLRLQGMLQLQVFDYQGKMTGGMESDSGVFHLKKGNWPAGIYFIKITQNGRPVGSGKLIAQ